MKLSITFEIHDADDLQAKMILASMASLAHCGPMSMKAGTIEETTDKAASQATAAAVTEPEKPKRVRRTKKEIAAAKAAEAEAAKAAEVVDEDPFGVGPEVTLDDLKNAVRQCIEANGVDAVKAIFEQHSAAKISEIKETDYATVLEALNG